MEIKWQELARTRDCTELKTLMEWGLAQITNPKDIQFTVIPERKAANQNYNYRFCGMLFEKK